MLEHDVLSDSGGAHGLKAAVRARNRIRYTMVGADVNCELLLIPRPKATFRAGI